MLEQGRDALLLGANEDGEFANNGVSAGQSLTEATALTAALQKAGTQLADFEVRYSHAIAIDSNGALWGWGTDVEDELGIPRPGRNSPCQNVPCFATPQPIPFDGGAVVRVALGENISYVLTADGTLWAFGSNWLGTLGHAPGSGNDTECLNGQASYACNAAPTPVPLPP